MDILDKDAVVYMGYTRGQLAAAFDRVKDDTHWKNPINKVVEVLDEAEMALIDAAVVFYAGCGVTFTGTPEANVYRVRAPGYFMTIGP